MITLFCGYEPREAAGFHVFLHSVIARATVPVRIIPLSAMGLPEGSNAFTLSRFLVPWLMGFKGRAIFADASDMLMLGDVAELDALFDPQFGVQVVKHPNYQPKEKVKYRGTEMETLNLAYERKNWASLMLINCEHADWFGMTPDSIATANPLELLQMKWATVGEIPGEWNRIVDEGHYLAGAKLLHWTCGIPGFDHYRNAPGADLWHAERKAMNRGC